VSVPAPSLTIGGQEFSIDRRDPVFEVASGECISTVLAGSGTYAVGAPFLRNVVAVFDFGKQEMSFTQRKMWLICISLVIFQQ
jgi:hypothetical protein